MGDDPSLRSAINGDRLGRRQPLHHGRLECSFESSQELYDHNTHLAMRNATRLAEQLNASMEPFDTMSNIYQARMSRRESIKAASVQ